MRGFLFRIGGNMKIRKPVEGKAARAGKMPKASKAVKLGQHRQPINKHGSRHFGPHESLNPPFEKL
jgi:hypothetical protein